MGFLFIRLYSYTLRKHPLKTNMVTTGTVFFLGDVLSQQIVLKKGNEHDLERTARSVAMGSCFSTPLALMLYNLADRIFGRAKTPLNSVRKIGLLSLFSPFNNSCYIACNNLLRGNVSWTETLNQITETVPGIVLASWSVWVPTSFVLFIAVPLRHRVFVSNLVGVLWTGYLTHATNPGKAGDHNVSSSSRE